MLLPGELKIRKGEEKFSIAVAGGFLEVRSDSIVVLADVAERDDEIDISKAQEAKRQAELEISNNRSSEIDKIKAEAALCHAIACIKIAEKSGKTCLKFTPNRKVPNIPIMVRLFCQRYIELNGKYRYQIHLNLFFQPSDNNCPIPGLNLL
jgi:hypothetical protein